MRLSFHHLPLFVAAIAVLGLGACSSDDISSEAKYPTGHARDGNDIYKEHQSIFGDGLSILGGNKKDDEASGSGIGVNSFLWRATLDTVSFMPLASADPFGGVILTDWHQPDAKVGERFKVNVFIMGRQLRSDGVRVRTFKQRMTKSGWVDMAVEEEVSTKLEDTILTRARQIRVAQED